MSIAISARIGRSRLLASLCFAMAGVLLAAAALLMAGVPALSAVCAIAAAGLALFPLAAINACRIDVTDIGQILLTHTAHEAVADRTDTATASA